MTDERRNTLKSYLTDYARCVCGNPVRTNAGAKILIRCPNPRCNPRKKTEATYIYQNTLSWFCWSCREGGDIFDMCAIHHGWDIKRDWNLIEDELNGLYIDHSSTTYRASAKRTEPLPGSDAPEEPPTDWSDYYASVRANIEDARAVSYLSARGIGIETARTCGLGFDPSWKSPKGCKNTILKGGNPDRIPATPRIITPTTQYSYEARCVKDCTTCNNLKCKENGWKKMAEGGKKLFNLAALQTSEMVFVTEGPFDALSFIECGADAIALNSTSNDGLLEEYLQYNPTSAMLLLCLDSDKSGTDATDRLAGKLDVLGIKHCDVREYIMLDGENDPNESLQKYGKEAFESQIDSVLEICSCPILANKATNESPIEKKADPSLLAPSEQPDMEEPMQLGSVALVDSFLDAVQTRKYEPIATGISDLDRALYGGLMRQQLVLFGAAPGAGKTALAQWMFEGMAAHGTDCVFINLEMSSDQLIARSLSRMIAGRYSTCRLSAAQILQGYKWDPMSRDAVREVAEDYKRDVAPHITYNPNGVDSSLGSILLYMERAASAANAAGKIAPIFIIDYLQCITGEPREDAAQTIKRAIHAFKKYAIENNTIVFVIMANGRESNKTGDVTMESGRDTSNIEYGADLQLGLAFTLCMAERGKDRRDRNDLTPEEKKQVSIKITKSRFADGNSREIKLIFDGATMSYNLAANCEVPYAGTTPFDEPSNSTTKKVGKRTYRK